MKPWGDTVSPEVISRDFAIPEDLREKAPTDCFTPVHGNNGAPPIRMSQKMMAAPDANNFKSELLGGL